MSAARPLLLLPVAAFITYLALRDGAFAPSSATSHAAAPATAAPTPLPPGVHLVPLPPAADGEPAPPATMAAAAAAAARVLSPPRLSVAYCSS